MENITQLHAHLFIFSALFTTTNWEISIFQIKNYQRWYDNDSKRAIEFMTSFMKMLNYNNTIPWHFFCLSREYRLHETNWNCNRINTAKKGLSCSHNRLLSFYLAVYTDFHFHFLILEVLVWWFVFSFLHGAFAIIINARIIYFCTSVLWLQRLEVPTT